MSTLSEDKSHDIERSRKDGKAIFKFGDGVEKKSKYQVQIPAIIGKKEKLIVVDIVECNIPLLISKPTMIQLEMTIDFINSKATALGQRIKLETTMSGHYCIPISRFAESCNIIIGSQGILGQTDSEKKKKAIKLHRQLCHASFERLKTPLRPQGSISLNFLLFYQRRPLE